MKVCEVSMLFSVSKLMKKNNTLIWDRTFAVLSPQIKPPHTPVMLEETLSSLDVKPQSTIIDMTFGAGGHTKEILSRYEDCRVIALDRDEFAFKLAKDMAANYQ